MAEHDYRRRSSNNPSEGSWSCTPDGVCRFNPNNNNHNHHQQQQGFVMKFETSFEHLQPSHNHGLVVKEPPKPKPKPVEEFLTKVQTEASQPQAPFSPNSQSPPQRFQIPISSAGHRDNTVFADIKPNKQDKERGPTHGRGHGGWDEPHQHHQFMERSWSNNDNDHKGDYFTKETRPPWTHDTRWLTRKSSSPDNRLSRPVNDIDEALEVLKGFAIMPQLPDKEAKSMHSNADMKPSLQRPNRGATNMKTISSREAAEMYGGTFVP